MEKLFIYIIISFVSIGLHAQDTLSLKECISYALTHSLQHQQLKYELEQEELNVHQTGFNFLPSVEGYTSGGMSYGRSIDPTSNSYVDNDYFSIYGELEADWVLFEGFSKQNERAYAKYRKQAAQWGYLNNEDDLAFQILNAYYNVAYYSGLIVIAEQQLKISEFNLQKTEVQIETGLQAKSDLLQIKASLEQSKLDILNAKNNAEEMLYGLLELMNYPILENPNVVTAELSDSMALINIPNTKALFDTFCAQSPSLKMGEANVKAAEKYLSAKRSSYMPTLTLNAVYSSNYTETYVDSNNNTIAFNEQLNRYLSKYIGATLSIPIFTQHYQRTQVKKAIISKEMATTSYEQKKQTLYYQIANSIREIKALQLQVAQTQQKVKADELAYQVAEKKYNEGLLNIIELLSVQEQVAQSKSESLLATIKFTIKSKTLEFYQGNRFWQY